MASARVRVVCTSNRKKENKWCIQLMLPVGYTPVFANQGRIERPVSERARRCDRETPHPTTCGDLLKTFRTRAHLTQQALAARAGVSFNTLSKGERGLYLPDSKGMV